ncbi:MAG: hypothetical protein DMD61_10405 [Gemmatimonadetes bacterium]|nr:MAG: hypothetical protein DMD61_10405 [Gemmatimonadota bacterium]
MSARTLTELFFDAVERYANHPAAFRYKADGTWRSVTHRAVAERVQALAVGLRELSLGAGEKVAIRCSAPPPRRWRRSRPCAPGYRPCVTSSRSTRRPGAA